MVAVISVLTQIYFQSAKAKWLFQFRILQDFGFLGLVFFGLFSFVFCWGFFVVFEVFCLVFLFVFGFFCFSCILS